MTNNIVHGVNVDDLLKNLVQRQSMMSGAGVSIETADFFRQAASMDNGLMIKAAQSPTDNMVSKQVTDIIGLLDASDSMNEEVNDGQGNFVARYLQVIDGFNEGFLTDIQDARNPEREQQRLTLYTYNSYETKFVEVEIDSNGDNAKITGNPAVGVLEVNSIPIVDMPQLHAEDYVCQGGTPMNPTIMMALGAASLQAEALANGLAGKRTASTKFVIAIGDGGNTRWSHQGVSTQNSDIKVITNDLRAQETWMLLLAMTHDSYVDVDNLVGELGFHKGQIISAGGWRKFMNIVSRSATQVSQAGGSTSQLAQNNQFFAP